MELPGALTTFLSNVRLRKYLLLASFLLAMFFSLYLVQNKIIYTFGFTDEGDNISIGKFLNEKKLYQEVFSQHQPLTYYVSSTLQAVSPADNILLVIRRHRQFVMLFSFAWIAFLTFRFGYRLLPFVFLIEILKYYYLGHLFLAESLVIYPLIYLFSLWWQSVCGKKLTIPDALLASLSAFFIVFNLIPLVVVVGVIMLALLFLNRRKIRTVLALLVPGLLATILLFTFVPLTSYIETTIWANLNYYIPNSNTYAFKVQTGRFDTLIHMLVWPILYLRAGNIFDLIQLLIVLSWLVIASCYALQTKQYVRVAVLYLLLAVTNTRPPIDSMIYFHAFHSLPFFGVMVMSLGMFWSGLQNNLMNLRMKLVLIVPFLIIFGLLLIRNDIYYREEISERDTPFIQFSNIYLYSDTIRALAKPGDTLAVYPYEELLYWYTDIYPPTRFLFYQSWVYDVPAYKKEITDGLRQNPPTFVYAPATKLTPYLHDEDYLSLSLHEATASALFVRKASIPTISEAQWKDIQRNGFTLPITPTPELIR